MRQSHTASFSGFSTATTRRSMTRTLLALAQRLVDELDRLSQCCVLSGLRRADDLLGHPGGEGCVGRVVVGAGELRVFLGDRSPANHDGDLVTQAGLLQSLDVHLEHRHRGGEESGEADDVRFVGAHRFYELLWW